MDVAFLHVGEPTYVRKMIASVRAVMPHARLVQMTDETTPALEVDEVIRRPYDGYLMTFRLDHLAAFEHSAALILDTDVIVKRDVSHIWDRLFDVALTRRDGTIRSAKGRNIVQAFPYNTGVMFSRSPQFWRDGAAFLREQIEPAWRWWGDQWSVVAVASRGAYRVLDLPCDLYNWTPQSPEETSDAAIWHFKGANRKAWM